MLSSEHPEYSWERATAENLLDTDVLHRRVIKPRATPQVGFRSPRFTSQVRRRGLQRYLSIIVDGSKAMSVRDLTPSRMELTINCLNTFIPEFFDLNPISQLQLISARDGVATIVTPLSGTLRVYH
jgi:hypothetical protein